MDAYLEIQGGHPLSGEVTVSGAKNAALPLMIASLLTPDSVHFRNVPRLKDVSLVIQLLRHFGAQTSYRGEEVTLETPNLRVTEASYSLVKALRASFWVLGPLLARGGAARVALPGGDIIGARPVDMHLSALEKMGAIIQLKRGVVYAIAEKGLHPAEIDFRFPSVGATHQILMAAALTPGETCIRGAAREPEVVALAEMLTQMGAEVRGAGTAEITIRGSKRLEGTEIDLIGDRIEAATYILAGAATGSQISVKGFDPAHLGRFLSILEEMGVRMSILEDGIAIEDCSKLQPVSLQTCPFPGVATDIQAPLMACLCVAQGESRLDEGVFEGRFGHVSELARMGARITVDGQRAHIEGKPGSLTGARVDALDIRAGAALVVAALAAEGNTQIHELDHLRRGYSKLEEKLTALGAKIRLQLRDPEDYLVTGC